MLTDYFQLATGDRRITSAGELHSAETWKVGQFMTQSQHLRTFCPWRAIRVSVSRFMGITWRVRKYETRARLLPLIQSAGFRLVARVPIRCSFLDFLWPFDLEYLAVLEPKPDA